MTAETAFEPLSFGEVAAVLPEPPPEGRLVTAEIDGALWEAFLALCRRYGIQDPGLYLQQWLARIIKQEGIEGRYWVISGAVVTRDDRVLVVGNEYARGKPLVWNLPGGVVEPGENLRQAAARELYEESGLEALQVGPLAWVVQNYGGPGTTGILAVAFEVTAWRGDLTLSNEERGGLVRRAEFVPYDEACNRLMPGSAIPFRDWLAAPRDAPRFYWRHADELRLVE